MEQIEVLSAENRALKEKLEEKESVEKRRRLLGRTSVCNGKRHLVLGEKSH
jgi:hypothetical protein